MKKLLFVFAAALLWINADSQSWKECTGSDLKYDLSGFNILTIISEGFNYEETMDITNYWKKWGANTVIAGTLEEQHGERNNPATGKMHDEVPVTMKPDILLEDVDFSSYDLIYFPGGEGAGEFLKSHREQLRKIIDGAVNAGKYVAAICHSPVLLAASENLKGHRVTVQGHEFRPELQKSGAVITRDIFIADGKFMTGQWPYFETFASSVAEHLTYADGNGPFARSRENINPLLLQLLDQRNTFLMQPGYISDDTIKMIAKYSVNPLLPFEMANNASLRFVAIRDTAKKSALAEGIAASVSDRFVAHNVTREQLKRSLNMVFSAPVVLFVFFDEASCNSADQSDNEVCRNLNYVLAGQSIAQSGIVADVLGYEISVIGNQRIMGGEKAIIKVLDLPDSYNLVNIIGIGHSLEKTNPAVARPVDEYLKIY